MPAVKRKSTEANLENRLPPITELLQANLVNDAKRAKTLAQNAPLGDISNSPWPIKWTAFGTDKFVEDPLRPVAPPRLSVSDDDEAAEPEVAPAAEAPVDETTIVTSKKAAPKKSASKAKSAAQEPEPIRSAPGIANTTAPIESTEKPAAKKRTPKGTTKSKATASTDLAMAPEAPVVAAPTHAKQSTTKKATKPPASKESPPETEADATKTKPTANKAASKAKAKTAELAPTTSEVSVRPAPAETTKTKKATKSKTNSKPAEDPTPVAEPEVPAPAPAPAATKKSKAAKEPKEPDPKPSKAAKGALPEFISTVYLDGQDTDSVPVFDTCDVVRRKINAALSSTTHTKASLLRAFAACTSEPDRALPPNSFQRFLAAKGKIGGCTNRTFYAAYVYFEKQRIAEKKKKTKTREEMETAWGPDGMDYENLGKPVWISTGRGESLTLDQYGRQHVIGPNGRVIL